jgi:predicted ATPase/transcriptional regulator with XRE-family HTH domain
VLAGTDGEQGSFGAQLRRLRKRAGLSQAALAERAVVDLATVKAIEHDRRSRPHPQTLARLTGALGLASAERDALLAVASGVTVQPTDAGQPSAGVAAAPWAKLVRLPEPPTPLFGREADVAQLTALLDPALSPARLLTLVGPGGVGKTRLAVAVAAGLIDAYPDGVVFVDLAPLRDPRLVAPTIARTLGVREAAGRSAREILMDYLQARQMLLVLDNFEHLLAAAPLLGELQQGRPRLHLMVTSRAPLRLQGERRFRVAPLAVPAQQPALEEIAAAPAVRLFVERAMAPDLTLEARSARAVAEICRRLDGLPLAIELAAARVELLGPVAMLDRLERHLPLLTHGAVDLPKRQQTLHHTLAWSFDLLGSGEQILFRRVGVFAGGWTLQAAEVVCADAELPSDDLLERMGELVDSSLVQRTTGADGEPRFGMLETIREYAVEQLSTSGELEQVRTRHRDWYVAWSERVLPELTGPDQLVWYARVAAELENFRAAREWCQQDALGAMAGLRLAGALGRYFEVRAPGREARHWLAQALADGPSEPSVARARALTWCGQLDCGYGEADVGRARLEESAALARRVGDRSLLSLTLRHHALYTADRATAPSLLEEAVAEARAAGDRRELAFGLCYLGIQLRQQGDEKAAGELYAEAIAAARASGDMSVLTATLFTLGDLEIDRGEYAAAQSHFEEALALSQRLDYRAYTTRISRQLAHLALQRGDVSAARAWVRSSLELARVIGESNMSLHAVRMAARLAAIVGDHRRAVRLFSAVAGWQGRHGVRHGGSLWTSWTWTLQNDEEAFAAERAALGEAEFDAAWSAGALLSLEEALDDALAAAGSENDSAPSSN